jgi:hypothetical protein
MKIFVVVIIFLVISSEGSRPVPSRPCMKDQAAESMARILLFGPSGSSMKKIAHPPKLAGAANKR